MFLHLTWDFNLETTFWAAIKRANEKIMVAKSAKNKIAGKLQNYFI